MTTNTGLTVSLKTGPIFDHPLLVKIGSEIRKSVQNRKTDIFSSPAHNICFYGAKATQIFSAKNIRILYIESAKTVNEMTLNELVKLTML